eukprot:15449092-Heterocapsa_arctica.AAC.1
MQDLRSLVSMNVDKLNESFDLFVARHNYPKGTECFTTVGVTSSNAPSIGGQADLNISDHIPHVRVF